MFEAYNAVRDSSKQRDSALMVLYAIAQRAHADWEYAEVKVEWIAQDVRKGERQVQRIMGELVLAGELIIVPQSGYKGKSRYWIPLYDDELGYDPQPCEDKSHRCNGMHTPMPFSRVAEERREKLARQRARKMGDKMGDIAVTPISKPPRKAKEMGDIAVTPKGDIAVTPKGDIAVTPKGDIAVTPETLNRPLVTTLSFADPSTPPVFVKQRSRADPEALAWGEDGMPELSARLRAFGVRRVKGQASWSMTRNDIAHDRPVPFEQWERMHYWNGKFSSQAEREAEYARFETAIIARRTQRAILASQVETLAAVE